MKAITCANPRFMSLKEISFVFLECFQPAQDKDKLWAMLKSVMKLGVP